jgi:hypothetical protein
MFWKKCACVEVDNNVCHDTCEIEPYYGETQHTNMILRKFRKKIKIVQAICKTHPRALTEDIEALLVENGFIVIKYPVGMCNGGPQLHADTVYLWSDDNKAVQYWRYLCVNSGDLTCT